VNSKVINFSCLLFHIWDCGDDDCGCTHPAIIKVEAYRQGGRTLVRQRQIWKGSYLADGQYRRDDEEMDKRTAEYAMLRRIAVQAHRDGYRVEWWLPLDGTERWEPRTIEDW